MLRLSTNPYEGVERIIVASKAALQDALMIVLLKLMPHYMRKRGGVICDWKEFKGRQLIGQLAHYGVLFYLKEHNRPGPNTQVYGIIVLPLYWDRYSW